MTRALDPAALLAFLQDQRWFGGKARQAASATLIESASFDKPASPAPTMVILEVRYRDGGSERYHLPVVIEGAQVRDALDSPDALRALLAVMLRGGVVTGAAGDLSARPVAPVDEDVSTISVSALPSVHSNSAVRFDDRFLLKLFRRVESGLNPDVEIGRFLAECGASVPTPRLLGTIEYLPHGDEPATLALLQTFVASERNAWELALDAFAAAMADAPNAFPDAMALLGTRTAELHRALAAAPAHPDFAPVVVGKVEIEALGRHMIAQSQEALDLLASRIVRLPEPVRRLAHEVLAHRQDLMTQMASLADGLTPFVSIRIHGDYHLGQVLSTGADFVIIDFEGEPTRPLAERRARQSPLRDVAGMLRSLSYAAHAGVRQVTGADAPEDPSLIARAGEWESAASAAFLEGYLEASAGAPYLPAAEQFRRALDLFLYEKALYELAYELNNRPDWVATPLSGILSLIGSEAGS